MAWVDSTYLGNALGTSLRDALFPSSDVIDQYELTARATVCSVMQYAGYAAPSVTLTSGTVTSGFLQKLLVAIMCRDAAAIRKGITLPSAVSEGLVMLDQVYQRKLPIPGLEPEAEHGYGGVRFSPTSASATGARPQIMSRDALTKF